jgi:hypothetical protein
VGAGRRGPYAAVVDALTADPRVITATRVAYTFGIDPISVLDADTFTWNVRVAALQVYEDDHRPPEKTED